MPIPKMCPLCFENTQRQSVVTSHVYGDENKTQAFYHCQNCDVRYQFPGLTPEEESRLYNAEFEGFMEGRSGPSGGWRSAESHITANRTTVERRMKYVLPNLDNPSVVLEVGCSSGFMLFPLKERGHKCIGIEPSGLFSTFVKSKGISVYESIEKMKQKESNIKFDIIKHYFVLEHISNPILFLKTQLDLLKDGGKIIFEIPNVADALYTIYDIAAFEKFYWSIAHHWYFSEKSLRYLLDQVGMPYEIILDQRYDLSNHMIWARDGKPGGMNRFTDKLGVEIEENYKQALIKAGKCDTLIGIITKK